MMGPTWLYASREVVPKLTRVARSRVPVRTDRALHQRQGAAISLGVVLALRILYLFHKMDRIPCDIMLRKEAKLNYRYLTIEFLVEVLGT